ncbi:MAG: hypothetical protein CMO12_01080 [Thaumarchaeota archaeon]|nr:hypothetical protein [Nitrososphaerota archaeon]
MNPFKIFQNEKKDVAPAKSVMASELSSWLNKKKGAEFQYACSEATKICSRTIEICSVMSKSSEDLTSSEVTVNELTEKYLSTITTAKDTLGRKIKTITANMELPEITTFEDIVRSRDLVQQTIVQLGEAVTIHGRYISLFPKREIKALQETLKEMVGEQSQFQQIVDENSTQAEEIQSAGEETEQLIHLIAKLERDRILLVDLQKEIKSLELARVDATHDIKKMEENEVTARIPELKEEVQRLKETLTRLDAELMGKVLILSRPLKKYSYIGELERPKRKILEDYLDKPLDTLRSDGNLIIVEILADLKKQIQDGKIELKDPSKALQNADELLAYVGEFLDRYEPIERSIERKRETINAATSRELDNLRTQLALLDKNKKNKELDAVDLNTRIKGEQQSVVEQIAVVEEKIEQALGENIKIQT